MNPLLRLQDISIFTPDGRTICSQLNLKVSAGELVIIEGENGSGKTTLIKVILGLYPHFRGQIEKNFSHSAYLPQLGNVQFFLPLTLFDVIRMKSPKLDPVSILNLDLLRDTASLRRPWNTASGGERQKTMLSSVLLRQSELLVLDEPFNHLDRQARKRVVELIHDAQSAGAGILLISHERVLEFDNSKRICLDADAKKDLV